ncbi:MAG TPA: hypothetical protein ENG51_08460, partial [Deltaproteobacteria bacterium]|nr:hypothetical protein [Deltaproteobacteria bacterium]
MRRTIKLFLCTCMTLLFIGLGCVSHAEIKIGSKNLADHVVLGKALCLYLKVHSLPVVDKTNYGGSMDLRRAILTGDIDLYFESLSTAWFNFFHRKTLESSPEYLYVECKKLDRKNGLRWLAYTPANRTFALVIRKDDSTKMRIDSISDWIRYVSKAGKKVTVVLPKELGQAETLMSGLVKHYVETLKLDSKFPYKAVKITHSLLPGLVSNGTYSAGLSFATLGKIDYFDLVCLKDDLSFFPAYNLSPVARAELVIRYVRLPFLLNMFCKKVTTDILRRFDYLVSEEKRDPEGVAKAWLIDKKLV